jgi:hypothetical protein
LFKLPLSSVSYSLVFSLNLFSYSHICPWKSLTSMVTVLF